MLAVRRWTADECTLYGFKGGQIFWYPIARWGWTLSLPFMDVDVSRETDGDLRVDVSRPAITLAFYRWGAICITARWVLRLGWRVR